jgi:iron complex outermembrane receptor protein
MPPYLLAGGTQFRSEKVIAFEVGYRSQPTSDLLYSLTGFANRYDDLRTVEPTTVVGPPFVLANKLHGTVYGLEAWSSYQVMSGWRLRAGATLLSEHLRPDSDSLDPSAVSGAGNDPKHQGLLRSSIDLASNVGFDLTLRSVGRLPNPAVPAYTAVDARLGWSATPKIELSVTGTNLFDGGHPEFGTPATRSQIGRGGLAKLEWRL